MADLDADDPTVPTGRAGVDPLIAFPKLASGETGQIERPGDQTPWWFIPGLCAVAVFFIGLLATINQDRVSDREAAQVEVSRSAGSGSASEPSADGVDPAPLDTDIVPAETAPDTTIDQRVADLPPSGLVRIGGEDLVIESRCEVHLPYDPTDTAFQVSSYFFFDQNGERQLIDRIFDGDTERARLLDASRFVELDDIGDAGAFVASFSDADGQSFEVVVNPAADAVSQCGDRVVTNAPGQFATPHTRVILDLCVDRTTDSFATIVGLTSEGARFEILQAGGELGEIVFVERDAEPMRTAAPAFIIRTGDVTSASGVVSEGANDLDITIDIGNETTEADARTCVASDRL